MSAPGLDAGRGPLHAGLLALRVDGAWRGALLHGPSGVGKSDLALRASALGFRLVADDRVDLFVSGGRLWGCAPPPLAGMMEARGVGVGAAPYRPLCAIDICVALVGVETPIERCPASARTTLRGVAVPTLVLRPLEPSAPAKLAVALRPRRLSGDPGSPG